MKLKTLHDLYAHQIHELCQAERESIDVLATMRKAALAPALAAAFEDHRRSTADRLERLETIIDTLPEATICRTGQCQGMHALFAECMDSVHEDAAPHVRDAMLISLAQRIEHEEIAIYGCVRTWAHLLGEDEAAGTLQQSLETARELDQRLTVIAQELNQEALAAGLLT